MGRRDYQDGFIHGGLLNWFFCGGRPQVLYDKQLFPQGCQIEVCFFVFKPIVVSKQVMFKLLALDDPLWIDRSWEFLYCCRSHQLVVNIPESSNADAKWLL